MTVYLVTGPGSLRARVPAELVVAVIAVLARLAVPLRGGGLLGDFGYDPGVYYAAADGLTHGQLPYRDYLLVHPPVAVYALTPFAALGRLTSDHAGFVAATLAFILLGALNAVLVVRLLKRLGLTGAPAVIGGLFYAIWFGAVGAEFDARLEPIGNTSFLVGLLLLARSRAAPENTLGSRSSWLTALLAGATLALSMSVKIWWAVPVVLVLAWELVIVRSPRRFALLVLGAAGASVVVDGAPFLLSHGRMWSMIVSTQLGRAESRAGPMDRLGNLTTVEQAGPHLTGTVQHVIIGLLAAGFVVLCALAARTAATRLFVVLAIVQLAVLLATPSWFQFYADYAAIAASVTVGGAAAAMAGRSTARLRATRRNLAWLPIATVAALTLFGLEHSSTTVRAVPDQAALARAARSQPCIMSDYPMALIEANALSRSFDRGCHDWVDVTAPVLGAMGPADREVRGVSTPAWSAALTRYLSSGTAVIAVRRGIGLTSRSEHELTRGGALAKDGPYTLYRITR